MTKPPSITDRIIKFSINNPLIIFLLSLSIVFAGYIVAPFDWNSSTVERHPVPVDAIPDIGENQQIIFTKWPGRSPKDIEDQVTYPLTTAMLGLPQVKTVRSFSMFGISSIYVIFEEDAEFYWSRSRILEKLNSLPQGTLPDGVQAQLGPDATGLGQIFWYTLEGRDPEGNVTGGWDLQELRSAQDWYVRYGLMAAEGVSEVASIGGHVLEYQIDVDPDALRTHEVTLPQVFQAVKMSNKDVGARTIEINQIEYVIRGLGFIKSIEDIENTVVKVRDNIPLLIKDVATVKHGPALRRGILDKEGAEAVGGVIVSRYGFNPLEAIKSVKEKIKQLSPGLPEKIIIDFEKIDLSTVRDFATARGFEAENNAKLNQEAWLKWYKQAHSDEIPDWLTHSKLSIAPFYDRSKLIQETLDTLETALSEEILITVIVLLVMLAHMRSSFIVSLTLPLAVLICFIAMKFFKVDANVVALSGIAIAIGTIVDMGVIICENILATCKDKDFSYEEFKEKVFSASSEVGSAVLTAVLTTIVSFLPVFTMEGAEGKLFKPLAFTKTFALFAAVIVAITVTPLLAKLLFHSPGSARGSRAENPEDAKQTISTKLRLFLSNSKFKLYWRCLTRLTCLVAAFFFAFLLTKHWQPLGEAAGLFKNLVLVCTPIAGLLIFFMLWQWLYPMILAQLLKFKIVFLALIAFILFFGGSVWLGFAQMTSFMPESFKKSSFASQVNHALPGLGKEFMPNLDEGSFLYMPTTMTHASIGESYDIMRKQDMRFYAIPEVKQAVGKLGRVNSALDPAPISMVETIINYHDEYLSNSEGERLKFQFDETQTDFVRNAEGKKLNAIDGRPYMAQGKFLRDEHGKLIPDEDGQEFRNWRPKLDSKLNPGREAWAGIKKANDIWDEIVKAGQIPGSTSAPKLQPIAARIVMLQSGMRTPMGIKVKGPDLTSIENFAIELEKHLKEVPSINPHAVLADRIVGKPYLEIDIDREKISRYGLHIQDVQNHIEVAIGGRMITSTVEGRERYPVRVRYQRERRDSIEEINKILISAPTGQQIPLKQIATIHYSRGPQMIKNEDSFLTAYVLFDKNKGYSEVNTVEDAQAHLKRLIESGELIVPTGVNYHFSGSYENQIRAEKRLRIVLPLALFIIFIILYVQFKRITTTLMVFSAISVAWAGGFIFIWFYGQSWFLDMEVFGSNLREIFNIHQINLSVAVWVGFLALFGIATDDGVVMGTFLSSSIRDKEITNRAELHKQVIAGAKRRIRPCLMTTATTLLALLPVLSSTGRGSDIMVPMAIPTFGGMLVAQISVFFVPILFAMVHECTLILKWQTQSIEKIFMAGLSFGLIIAINLLWQYPQGDFMLIIASSLIAPPLILGTAMTAFLTFHDVKELIKETT